MKWLSIDANIFQDGKIKSLLRKFDGDGYTIYLYILTQIASNIDIDNNQNGYFDIGNGDNPIEALSWELHLEEDKVEEILDTLAGLELIDQEKWEDDKIYVPKLLERRQTKKFLNKQKAGRAGGQVSKKTYSNEWYKMVDFFENRCVKCGEKKEAVQTDHILPKSKGGPDDITNYQPMCRDCNYDKGDGEAIDYRPRMAKELGKEFPDKWKPKGKHKQAVSTAQANRKQNVTDVDVDVEVEEEKTTTTSNEVNQELQDYHKNPPDKDHQDWTAQDCVKNFYHIYYDATGTIAKPNWGKEGKQAKRLLDDHSAKEIDGATRYLFYRKAKDAKLSKGKQFGWVKGTMKEYQEWAAEQRQLSEEQREWENDREKAEQIIDEIADEF